MSHSSISKLNNLLDKSIVITRPLKQAESLAKKIKKVGGCPFLFPLIEITPLHDEGTINQLRKLKEYELIIFVSVNAVEHGIELVGADLLRTKRIATTGKKTALALESHGLTVGYCPNEVFNSEALLAVKDFKVDAANKNIAIIRGSGGRDYLKNNLIKLGANVDYVDVYKRHCPQKDLSDLDKLFHTQELDVVLLTSASSTANFFALTNNEKWLDDITLLIGSPRMQQEIPKEFRGKIVIADDPSDETLFKCLNSLYE